MEQELLTFPEHPKSSLVFSGVYVVRDSSAVRWLFFDLLESKKKSRRTAEESRTTVYVARYLVFCVVFCTPLFVPLSFFFSDLLRFTASVYPYDFFKFLLRFLTCSTIQKRRPMWKRIFRNVKNCMKMLAFLKLKTMHHNIIFIQVLNGSGDVHPAPVGNVIFYILSRTEIT